MCGIIGYTGAKDAAKILLDGLKALEYRGYDSSGVSLAEAGGIKTYKTKGRVDALAKMLKAAAPLGATCGIGHTRWATHGAPSDTNAHPHFTKNLSLVHNGIIENHTELAEFLAKKGYTFQSETDTEVAAKLIDFFYLKLGDPLKAIFEATKILKGSYAFGIIFADRKGDVFCTRKDSPLLAAIYDGGGLISSDLTAILPYTKSFYRLNEGLVARVTPFEIEFFDQDLSKINLEAETTDIAPSQAQKGGFKHFMLKEIFEEPYAVEKTLSSKLKNGLPFFGIKELDTSFIESFKSVRIVACGTAMHAGLVGKWAIERLARISVHVEIASEFRYSDPIIDKNELVIFISQSGETADTLAALRYAKSKGAYTLGIVNVMGSTLAREADGVIFTHAGPEIAVASTKAYTVQCAALYLLAARLALGIGKIGESEAKGLCTELLTSTPLLITEALGLEASIAQKAKKFTAAEHLFFIGRGIDHAIAAEASLKLKEISYIHSEAYAAGELKHGTISLITEGTPVIAVITDEGICEKTVSAIREVKARGAYVLGVCAKDLAERYAPPCDDFLIIPDSPCRLSLFPATTILQAFAYFVADQKGLSVDKPRNLAKSVTVE